MEVEKEDKKLLYRALEEWREHGLLSGEQADALRRTVVEKSDRQQVARYFFFVALFCTLLAFGAIFLSEKLLERIKAYFAWSDVVIAGITAALSVAWFWFIGKRRHDTRTVSYEVYMALGGLSVLTSLLYVCKYLHADANYATFAALSFAVLAAVSIYMSSVILWVAALLCVTFWFGEFTMAFETDYRFLGMNYPLRFVAFGALMLGLAYGQGFIRRLQATQRVTYVFGLLLFFLALWAVSIFGNFNSLEHWQQVRQVQVLAYSILSGVAAVLSFYLGVRFSDATAKDVGIAFLLLNLYTRYFEYFWDTMNKGIFFLVLAVTFGLLGRWLERKNRAGAKKLPG